MPWPRGRGRGESLTSPRRIAAKLRAVEAFKLRFDGLTYRQIAAALGYRSPSAAWYAVRGVCQAATTPFTPPSRRITPAEFGILRESLEPELRACMATEHGENWGGAAPD